MGSLRSLVCNHTCRDYYASTRRFYWHLEAKKQMRRFLKKELPNVMVVMGARSEQDMNDKTRIVRSLFIKSYGIDTLPMLVSRHCCDVIQGICDRKHYDKDKIVFHSGGNWIYACEVV